jgi:hypothetical protein
MCADVLLQEGEPASAVEIRNCRSTAEDLLHCIDGFKFLVINTLMYPSFYNVNMLLSRMGTVFVATDEEFFIPKVLKINHWKFFNQKPSNIPYLFNPYKGVQALQTFISISA